MIQGSRIGILGGTLDPVHAGHVAAATAARHALALDRVLVVPAGHPPHRDSPSASRYHRFAMAAIAVNGHDGLEVSDVEMDASGPSYTADTLARLHALGLAPSQLFFIIGADAFEEIATWRRYPAVLDMAGFAVVSRPGCSALSLRDRLPDLAARMTLPGPALGDPDRPPIVLVHTPTPDVSSTALRQRLESGQRVTGLVPDAVATYIRQHRLYARCDEARAIL